MFAQRNRSETKIFWLGSIIGILGLAFQIGILLGTIKADDSNRVSYNKFTVENLK